MPQPYEEFFAAVEHIKVDADKLRQLVQGDATVTVETEAGTLDSIAKATADAIADLEAAINAAGEGWLDQAQAARDAAQTAETGAVNAKTAAEQARDDASAIVYVAGESETPAAASIPVAPADDEHINPGWLRRDGAPDSTPLRADLGGAAFADYPVLPILPRDRTGAPATLTRDDEAMLVLVDDAAELPRTDYIEDGWSTLIKNKAGIAIAITDADGGAIDNIPAGATWRLARTSENTWEALHA